jgi:hypothetical protein
MAARHQRNKRGIPPAPPARGWSARDLLEGLVELYPGAEMEALIHAAGLARPGLSQAALRTYAYDVLREVRP